MTAQEDVVSIPSEPFFRTIVAFINESPASCLQGFARWLKSADVVVGHSEIALAWHRRIEDLQISEDYGVEDTMKSQLEALTAMTKDAKFSDLNLGEEFWPERGPASGQRLQKTGERECLIVAGDGEGKKISLAPDSDWIVKRILLPES